MISGSLSKPGVKALRGQLPGNVYYGIQGDPGKSAYQYAKEGGFKGTEKEFMELLANVDLAGYATEEWVQEGYQPKGNYLESDELESSVNDALQNAKESGMFDGPAGETGPAGPQGIPGNDGYSPVRGKDYWTDEDKAEIVRQTTRDIEVPTKTSQLINDSGYMKELPSHTHSQLNPAYTARQKSANIAIVGDNTLKKFVATSEMTTGKPTVGDGHILHFEWDNAGGYSTQVAVNNTTGQIEVRGMSGGVWNGWRKVLDSVNFVEIIAPYLYYRSGDSIYIDYSTATYVTSGGTRIRWAIFLGKEVTATSFNISGSLTVRQNGNYLFGDGNEKTSIASLTMENKKINANVLTVDLVKSGGYTAAINNSPVGVLFRGTITFT